MRLLGAGSANDLRAAKWEAGLKAAAEALGLTRAEAGMTKSSAARVPVAVLLHAITAVSNGWLVQRRAMGPPASVSQFGQLFQLVGASPRPVGKRAVAPVPRPRLRAMA